MNDTTMFSLSSIDKNCLVLYNVKRNITLWEDSDVICNIQRGTVRHRRLSRNGRV